MDVEQIVTGVAAGANGSIQTLMLGMLCAWAWKANMQIVALNERVKILLEKMGSYIGESL